ncbi:DUF1853 family protein [Aureibaculum sp. A20]|uniref:DUF1853 family protein n=1 Tax=Aureibaculum flavum TaxID=2795986 RepID=A0ABS0WR89_9FLAO|nr:DUF1853 family protein [Aureibaculum flavum]MBJ2174488.1 DUF1853 family protein [Aureibaculum flavum]
MHTKTKDIQKQYQGYINTSPLWMKDSVFGIEQFEFRIKEETVFNEELSSNLRLGKRVERFVSNELKQDDTIEIVLENKQIQVEKRTIGELDCILKQDDTPIHLEVIYKFYLFDERVGTTEIEHWIGPNRNDTLVKKLTKLKEKQLPLLYSEHTKPILEELKLNAKDIKQCVYFKAQLFVPYTSEIPEFKLLNRQCLAGFYIHLSEIDKFTDCKFYIPSKLNWLMAIQTQVTWLNFDSFCGQINTLIHEKKAPLCWLKRPNGTLEKFFVVWWS